MHFLVLTTASLQQVCCMGRCQVSCCQRESVFRQLQSQIDLLSAEMEPMQAPKRASTRSARIAGCSQSAVKSPATCSTQPELLGRVSFRIKSLVVDLRAPGLLRACGLTVVLGGTAAKGRTTRSLLQALNQPMLFFLNVTYVCLVCGVLLDSEVLSATFCPCCLCLCWQSNVKSAHLQQPHSQYIACLEPFVCSRLVGVDRARLPSGYVDCTGLCILRRNKPLAESQCKLYFHCITNDRASHHNMLKYMPTGTGSAAEDYSCLQDNMAVS
jgi:hypothetical protein